MSSPFTIYSASAGSGKTYQITKNYLLLLLSTVSKNTFKNILALTFTNKAVNEMKSRIINSLFEFGLPNNSLLTNPLFNELRESLNVSAEELQQKSKAVLHHILHNYGFFEVSTLDKFTHRIIRTFAKDLKISQNFEVALDTDLLLQESIDLLLEQAGNNTLLTKALVDFSLDKIDNDKSWNIAFDLFEVGKLLFQENHIAYIHLLKDFDFTTFESLTKHIKNKNAAITEQLQSIANSALNTIIAGGFEFADFPRETLPNHFKKIAAGEFHPKALYTNTLENQLKSGSVLKKSVAKSSDTLVATILPEYLRLKQLVYTRQFGINALKNLTPLSLLNEISKQLETIKEERDILPISEFNSIIANEIKNQPAPFIYERLGEKFHYYFIDEFQDTSQMQWENLIPLIANSLEGGQGKVMLVGDAKQAIYRWRGGKAEQFVNIFAQKSHPFTVTPQVVNLDTNWRSAETIINFNNAFFSGIAQELNNPDYVDFYVSGNQQKTNAKKDGYVEIAFVTKETTTEAQFEQYAQSVLNTIEQVYQHGYLPGDLCVLVRKNSQGIQLAEFLIANGHQVISPDALLLTNNPSIQFLVQLMHYLNDNSNMEAAFEVLRFLAKGTEHPHDFISNALSKLDTVLKEEYHLNIASVAQQSIYDIVESAIAKFNLADDHSAFVMHFLDVVFEFEKKEGASIYAFLNFWEKQQHRFKIGSPANSEAIQIMTIHKAKGLEFPVVIFPFADADILELRNNNKLWLPFKTVTNEIPLLFDVSKEMHLYNEECSKIYLEEIEKMELDSFNLLYVALTRAVEALFIISNNKTRSNSSNANFASLFSNHLKLEGLWDDNVRKYHYGKLEQKERMFKTAINTYSLPFLPTSKDGTKHKIVSKSMHLWNTDQESAENTKLLLHLLETIKYQEDVDETITNFVNAGHISNGEKETFRSKISTLLKGEDIQPFYSKAHQIFIKREFVSENGTLIQPDRFLITNNKVALLNFKTGTETHQNKLDLLLQAETFKHLGFTVTKKVLVYLNHTNNIIIV